MKRVFFLGIVALLALAVFSCDSITSQPSNVVGYTADGRAIVELELNVGLSDNVRALHPTLAKAASDYYEVIFYDDANTDYFRTTWREGKTARLRVPTGDYGYDPTPTTGNPNYAYIFAGRYEDNMLLGVGKLTSVVGGSGYPTEIDATTTGVTFTITALTTDVNNSGTSTFTTASSRVENIPLNGKTVPVFMLPSSVTTAATFDIKCVDIESFDRIVYAGGGGTTSTKPYAWPESESDLPIDLGTVAFTNLPAANVKVVFPIGLNITTLANINPDGKGGLCLLSIEVPVVMATNATSVGGSGGAAKVWYLKGGLNNSILDLGNTDMGMGGSVIIGSGNVLSGSGYEIGSIWAP